MEKVLSTLLSMIAVAMLCVGCQNLTETKSKKIISYEPEDVAKEYIENRMLWYYADDINARRETTTIIPEIFNNVQIEDENGNQIIFAELSEEGQKAFYKAYIDYYVETLSNKLKDATDLLEALETENTISRSAINKTNRALNTKSFYENYLSARNEYARKVVSQRASSSSSNGNSSSESSNGNSNSNTIKIEQAKLSDASIKVLRDAYKPGRIFICVDNSSASSSANTNGSSAFIGHAAIMCKPKWEPNWEYNSLGMATVSAWALKGNNVKWDGKIDGAQYEPIGYWGTSVKKGARSVKIYEMYHSKWKFSWVSLFTALPVMVHETPPTKHVNAAVDYAEKLAEENRNKGNHPYNLGAGIAEVATGIPLEAKWWDSTCYCSQLVWRSWCNAELTYDFTGLAPLVLPADIAAASNTKKIASYDNW